MSIGHPGSTSDYLAFVTSKLQSNLEKPDFLAPGQVLHGDNACIFNECMVTPSKMCLQVVKIPMIFINRK